MADHRWQDFILKKLGREISDKGIDGFFVDNCDVYFNYPKDEILDGLAVMMKGLVGTGKEVIINGGDCFLDAYCSEGSEYGESVVGGQWRDVITGINQETVYSRILWDGDKFSSASDEDREYFSSYIERYGDKGADIFLLEYTTDKKLIKKIDEYCAEHGYKYYVSDSVELDKHD